jgi:hypothetical protein
MLHLYGSVTPIHYSATEIKEIQEHVPCHVKNFPAEYLGLPLSIKRLTKLHLQPLIDRMANYLPGWKVDLMIRVGHAIQVLFVLTATIIYFAMALGLPQWAHKAIDKIRRSYMWRGRKDAKGGRCLMSCPVVTRPQELGGLRIANLKSLG